MNKSFKIASGITVAIAVIIGIGFLLFQQRTTDDKSANSESTTQLQKEDKKAEILLEQQVTAIKDSNDQLSILLSTDHKAIVMNDNEVLLAIDNDAIFDWFKTKSQLCDGYNVTSTPSRKAFCESKMEFKEQTQFKSIVVSPDGMEIGFTIESEALSPDTVVGIFLKSTNEIKLLTGYYLGNEFISFSPNGTHFIYTGECWEAMCGLFIGDSKTFNEVVSINNPEYLDLREWNAEFIQWISESEVEYKLQSTNSDEVKIERQSL